MTEIETETAHSLLKSHLKLEICGVFLTEEGIPYNVSSKASDGRTASNSSS